MLEHLPGHIITIIFIAMKIADYIAARYQRDITPKRSREPF
jgi:hypothetical protein